MKIIKRPQLLAPIRLSPGRARRFRAGAPLIGLIVCLIPAAHLSAQSANPGLQFVPLTPCRIMDTRGNGLTGDFGTPFISGGQLPARSVPVLSSTCGIPANALAYSLNLTVVPRTTFLGYLTVWPTGQDKPLFSNLNSYDGSILANAAIVPAGKDGAISVFATDDTEVVIDINGYFTAAATSTLQFYTVAPCRVLDTRNPAGDFGGPFLGGGKARSFTIPSSPCGTPASAQAFSFNVTVVPHGELGYLTVWPTDAAQPLVSTLNSIDGTVLANAAIVPAAKDGSVSFFATNDTELVVDINGYFAPPGLDGLNFNTLAPCRIADTRNATGPFGGPELTGGRIRAFSIPMGPCGIPATAQAYDFNLTVVPSAPLGYLTVWPVGQSQPVVSTLNAPKALVVANTALVPAGTGGSINAFVTDPTHLIIDIDGFFAPGGASNLTTISDFNPKSGAPGDLITVTGNNFAPSSTVVPQVILAKQSGGSQSVVLAGYTNTQLSFAIPTGVTTGPISVTGNQQASSAQPLTVVPPSSFTLTALPATANLIQGQSVAYSVQLASGNGFNQLAQLTLAGLPSGVTASFKPGVITAGQTSILTLTAPSGQPLGSFNLTLTASAVLDNFPVAQTATAQLSIQPPTTSLIGRTVVSDPLETPLASVKITMLGKDGNGDVTGCSGQTVSDAAGNFALLNLPQTCAGAQLVSYDGTTATAPAGKYAGVNLVYTLASGQATTPQVLIHLPRIDNQETFMVRQNASVDQSYSFSTIPHLSVVVYAGTTFTMPDGITQPDPFPLAAINVPVDRLPDVKPPVPTMITAFIVAFQPANATASQPVAVYYPNTLNNAPGVNMALLTLDPTHGAMVPYGTGTVSSDGTQIIPDIDSSHPGHRFGLVHFDWHMSGSPAKNQIDPCPHCLTVSGGDPVDVSSGLEVLNQTDISFGGARGSVSLIRTFRNGVQALQTNQGPFGFGTNHNYGYELGVVTPAGSAVIPLITPNGIQFPFSEQSDGTYVNTSGISSLVGAVMMVHGDQTVDLRWKDGTVFHFSQIIVGTVFRNLLSSIIDSNGNTTQILRSGFQISQIVDPVGRALVFTNNSDGTIAKVTGPDGRSVSYSYVATIFLGSGNLPPIPGPLLSQVTHLDGTTTKYEYDAKGYGNLTKITDGRGIVIASNTYDANNRVVQQVQANGGVLKFAYTLQNPTAPVSPVLAATVTDALDNQTVYRFSPTGAVLSAIDPLGQTRVFSRDSNNNVIGFSGGGLCGACGDPRGGDQALSYDALSNLLSVTDSLGNTTSFTYDPVFSKVTSITDPLGDKTIIAYDARGNPNTLTDPNGNVTTYGYDQYGELTTVTDPTGQTSTFTYDGSGNITAAADPLGNTTSFEYDPVGRLKTTKDALSRYTRIHYDDADRIVEIDNAQSFPTNFSYDQVGNLLSVVTGLMPCPASGCSPSSKVNTTSFIYDSMNSLVTRTDPLGRTDTRTYDANENLIKFQDRRGQFIFFVYDSVNRLTKELYDDSTVARSYDAQSRLSVVSDTASGQFAYKWNSAGMLLDAISPVGDVQYQRDGLGRATSRQVTGQPALAYSYDHAGNLAGATMPQASAAFTWDARNFISSITRKNGVASAFTFDKASRLLGIVHNNGTTPLDAENYTWDNVGNPSGHTTSAGQALITPAVKGGLYDADNEQTQFGAATNTFDANGNLASRSDPNGTTAYTWDSRNRLASIVTSSGQTTSFTYDFTGNMLTQSDKGPNFNLAKTFILDDLTNVAFETASDGSSYSVLSGRSIDSHLGIIDGAGNVQYSLSDAVNSTIASVDQAGTIQSTFRYEPFGQTTASGNYPFQFTGRQPVSSTLNYNRARFYNTQTGRFISEDPIRFSGGDVNLYRFVSNNPTSLTDPIGLYGFGNAVSDAASGLTQAIVLHQGVAVGVGSAIIGGAVAALVLVGAPVEVLAVAGLGVFAPEVVAGAIGGIASALITQYCAGEQRAGANYAALAVGAALGALTGPLSPLLSGIAGTLAGTIAGELTGITEGTSTIIRRTNQRIFGTVNNLLDQ